VVHARSQHPNAVLTPAGRRRMVGCVLERGWSIEATAERFQVDAKTVRKWRDRFVVEGDVGLLDRSSRPKRSPNRTARACRRRVVRLRRHRRWGADRIAHEVGIAASTVQAILRGVGLGRLDRGDRASGAKRPPRRYERERPGELVHVDVKKIAAIPPGGGWRMHGKAKRPRRVLPATDTSTRPSMTAPGSPTARSSATNKATPPPRSSPGP
jgi:transposase-like protein